MTSTSSVTSQPSQPTAPTLDGRLARSARTRVAIIDALRTLNSEGDLRPTAARVADRAGVSLRTVWQHFSDLESLLVEAGRRDFEIVRSSIIPIDPSLDLDARVEQFVQQRADIYEVVAPVWRAARLQEPFSPALQANRDRLLDLGREEMMRVFGAEVAALPTGERKAVTDALHAGTVWTMWDTLRSDLGLSVAASRRAMVALAHRLLAPASA